MRIEKKSKEINSVFNSMKKTGFVPTMGSLHKGHEHLIKKSVKQNHVTFVSIFLNPKQFNSKKDLEKICNELSISKTGTKKKMVHRIHKTGYSFKNNGNSISNNLSVN